MRSDDEIRADLAERQKAFYFEDWQRIHARLAVDAGDLLDRAVAAEQERGEAANQSAGENEILRAIMDGIDGILPECDGRDIDIAGRVVALLVRAERAEDALAAVQELCDQAEHGALRWENPLPVPEWVGRVRAALAAVEQPEPTEPDWAAEAAMFTEPAVQGTQNSRQNSAPTDHNSPINVHNPSITETTEQDNAIDGLMRYLGAPPPEGKHYVVTEPTESWDQ